MTQSEKAQAFAAAKEKIHAAIVATKKIPSSRATSLVLTKLEEAELWLRKSEEDSGRIMFRSETFRDPQRGMNE